MYRPGYLAGPGLASHQKSGSISGVPLPPGLTAGAKLPERVFTPTTRAAAGHDEPLTYADTVSLMRTPSAWWARKWPPSSSGSRWRCIGGVPRWPRDVACSSRTRSWSSAGEWIAHAGRRGADPGLVAVRPADSWVSGRPQHSLDKQFLRDWSGTLDWDRTPPGPPIPEEIVAATRARYVDVYERLTGTPWKG